MTNYTIDLSRFTKEARKQIIKIYTRLDWFPEKLGNKKYLLTIPFSDIEIFEFFVDSDMT